MAIGHDLHLQGPGGLLHTMMGSGSTMAIGKTVIVEWITTITGIATAIATIGIMITIATIVVSVWIVR